MGNVVFAINKRGEEALDGGPKGHSVFTGRLTEILESASDFITANELQASIREKVHSDASARNHIQTPSFGVLYDLGDVERFLVALGLTQYGGKVVTANFSLV